MENSLSRASQWTKNDVRSNGSIFMEANEQDSTGRPLEIQNLETRLGGKRSFNAPDDDPDLSILHAATLQFESTYIRSTEDHASIKSNTGFIAFYVLLRCSFADAPCYKTATSSSVKGHGLKGSFILPPFFSGQNSSGGLVYQEETPWKFPLFVSCPTISHLPRKYTPASDFSVWFRKLDLPLIIAEVI
ncbi:hypothetical protein BYT27DRAFT_6652892 [Phlegmacium glaucopus]|nr:hypothetical protein BYT27DRAFT_6652892 [Phlegmacium glaucopus]